MILLNAVTSLVALTVQFHTGSSFSTSPAGPWCTMTNYVFLSIPPSLLPAFISQLYSFPPYFLSLCPSFLSSLLIPSFNLLHLPVISPYNLSHLLSLTLSSLSSFLPSFPPPYNCYTTFHYVLIYSPIYIVYYLYMCVYIYIYNLSYCLFYHCFTACLFTVVICLSTTVYHVSLCPRSVPFYTFSYVSLTIYVTPLSLFCIFPPSPSIFLSMSICLSIHPLVPLTRFVLPGGGRDLDFSKPSLIGQSRLTVIRPV